MIDPLGNRFPLTYDANGNVSNRSTAALGAETDTFDAHNNLTKHVDGRG